ncbi:transposase [Azospirillum brasilense]|uniref:transposase n=1 Tax=Azospirillum brasilense TaxID=192 RepID=UPI003AF9EBAA|nr:transposase [Azospirillum brasilense]
MRRRALTPPQLRPSPELLRTRRSPRVAACSAVLGPWLKDALSCGIPAIETFADGVRQDEAAVNAGLSMPWSNGQTEGQVNKLKLIKRHIYGRGSFDLLRRRVLLAA